MTLRSYEVPLFPLYFHELFWLANAIKANCEAVFAETGPPPTGHYFFVATDLHARITAILIDSANIKKLIQTPEARGPKELKKVFELRRERTNDLEKLLEGLDLEEILNTKVRNTLEHFAEYLDEASVEIGSQSPPPAPMAAYNMAISDWAATNPRLYPVRLYVADERKFYNLKYSIDIGAIYNQSLRILERLRATPPLSEVADPGGLILPLGYEVPDEDGHGAPGA